MYNNYGYGYSEPLADQPMGYPTPQVGYSWGLGYTQQPQHQTQQQGTNKAPTKVYGTEWNPSAYGYGGFENSTPQPQPRPSTSSGSGASQYSEYQKYYYQSALQGSSPAVKPQQQQKSSQAFGGYGGVQTTPQTSGNKWWAATVGGSIAGASSAVSSPSAPTYSYNTSQYVTAAKNYYGRKQQQSTSQTFSQYLDEYSSQQRFGGGAESGANGQKRIPIVRKPPVDVSKFFCDVCKIQCGSDQVSSVCSCACVCACMRVKCINSLHDITHSPSWDFIDHVTRSYVDDEDPLGRNISLQSTP